MVELVDTQDLGSCAARRVGSSPTTRTKNRQAATGGLPVFYARVRGQGGSSHKWQLRCKCADPFAVFQQHAALFLQIRSTPFG